MVGPDDAPGRAPGANPVVPGPVERGDAGPGRGSAPAGCRPRRGRGHLARGRLRRGAFELFRAHQGQGFATEAAFAVLDAARATGRSRLWATVREWNAASFNVLTKLGFFDSGRRTIDPVHGDTTWMSCNL